MNKFIKQDIIDTFYLAYTSNLNFKNAEIIYKVLRGDFSTISLVKKCHPELISDSFSGYQILNEFKKNGISDDAFLKWNEEIFRFHSFELGEMSRCANFENIEKMIVTPNSFRCLKFYSTISFFYLFHKNDLVYRMFLDDLIRYFDEIDDFIFKNYDKRFHFIADYERGDNDDPYRDILEIICLKKSVTVENGLKKPYSVSYYYPDLKECNFVEMLKLAGCNELADFYIENIYKRAWKYLSNHEELFDLKYLQK